MIFRKKIQKHKYKTILSFFQVTKAHINCLKLAGPPPQSFEPLAVQTEQIKPTPRHRWCGTTVILTKQGHALKGNIFQVENVLFDQATLSGMRLELTNQQYSPYTPFQNRITVDYCDVVEQSYVFHIRWRRDVSDLCSQITSCARKILQERLFRYTSHFTYQF